MHAKTMRQSDQHHHDYDQPGLSPKQFLLKVMHDETVCLNDRIRAATYCLPLTEHPLGAAHEPEYTIIIPDIYQ
jgi:hypothetical protein